MKTIIAFLVFFLGFHSININAQIFIEAECGIISNPSYTYENYQNSNWEYGFNLYHNSVLIEHIEGWQAGKGFQVVSLKFINDTTGYFIYSDHTGLNTSYRINKIIGNKIIYLCQGYYPYSLHIVNAHLAYLINYRIYTINNIYMTDSWLIKCSDIQPFKQLWQHWPTSDSTINDTIIGMPLCQNQSELNFSHDSINYKILLHIIDSTYSINENGFSPWKVFPNPADDYISLTTNNPSLSCVINIFNSLGIMQKSVVFNQLSGQTIYVGDLKKGLYIVEINQGKIKYYHKMIKT